MRQWRPLIFLSLVWVVLVIGLVLAVVRFSRMNEETAIQDGRAHVLEVRQFDQLFGNRYHFITYYGIWGGSPSWNSKAAIHDRYVLTLQFPIKISVTGAAITQTGPPTFYLYEITQVTRLGDGRVESQSTGIAGQFGAKEWDKVVAAGGDFGVIGFKLDKDRPVDGFKENWEGF